MIATLNTIREWLNWAKEGRYTHLIVMCDEFDYSDYPVYISLEQNIEEEYEKWRKEPMQRVMEVYDLSLDIEAQLKETKALHLGQISKEG